MRACVLTGILLIMVFPGYSQGYKLDFKIEGLQDTTFLLGNFFGESTYVTDTAYANGNGEFTFEGNRMLPEGMYFLVLDKTRLFDFVIGRDQQFKMETSHPDYILNLKITGDEDNKLFLEDMLFNAARNEEAKPFVEVVRDSTASNSERDKARTQLEKVSAKVDAHVDQVINDHQGSVLAKIMKANRKLTVPEPPVLESGRPDSTWQYEYYKTHYWDDFDLADPTLLRLSQPVYRKKVEEYLDRLVVPNADSITKAIDMMVDKAKKDQEAYKYLVWTVTIKYQNPEIMGLDKVFVHLYDQYFASGEMDFWANAQLKKNLQERADQLRTSLVGMTAPNLIMQNANLQPRALHDMKNKYTIIYFYDPDCGHCKKETPKLKKFYEESGYDIGVYTVSADTSLAKMKDYIRDMDIANWVNVNGPRTYTVSYQKQYDALTTPTIYVLDRRKKIIAKKLPADRLEEFLTQYERVEARKNDQN